MYQRALLDSNEAIKLDFEMATAYFTRGVIYKHLGDRVKSSQDLARCLELTTDPALIFAAKAVLGTL
jgi:lipoprotein NlpI